MNIYLVEIAAYTGAAEQVFRFSTGLGYTSAPADTPANTYYQPRIEQPGLFKQNMFEAGKTSGNSTGGYGEIVLINTDGGLDAFIDYGFDGRVCTVKQGQQGQPLSSFATVITGTVEQCEVSWNRVTLRLKDRSAELQKPIQQTQYAGTNTNGAGLEGVVDLKDKPKPRIFGKCNNVTPVCCNTSKLIYQVNTAAVTIPAVYDNGVALTLGADYADLATLQSTEPAAGEYRCYPAGGYFRLGSSPAGDITADVVQGATAAARTVGQIVAAMVTERLGAGAIVAQSIIDLAAAAPYVAGYYTGSDNVNVSDALDTLCNSVGAWWGFDNAGKFWSKQLQAPDASQATTTLTQREITSIARSATGDSDKGLPTYKINVDFSKNWTVQKTGLAGSVQTNQLTFEPDDPTALTAERRNLLAMEYLRVSATDATVQTSHLLSPILTATTLLDAQADAQTEANRLLAMRKTRRDRLTVTVPMSAMQYPTGGFWDDEAISEMATKRNRSAAVVFNNWLYVIGGQGTASVIRLDLTNPTGAWDDVGVTDLPDARDGHSAVVFGNYVYVIGGFIAGSLSASVIRLDLTNPTGAWDDAGVTDLPSVNGLGAAAVFGNYVYIFGGAAMAGYTQIVTASVKRLDLTNPTGAWDDAGVTDLPSTRRTHTATVYGNYVYIAGGWTSPNSNLSSVIRLDLSNPTGAWDDAGVTDLPAVRAVHTAVMLNNYLYIIGGGSISVIRLDLANPTGAWDDTGAADLPELRSRACSVNYNGVLYLLGGTIDDVTALGNTWRYRINSNPADASQLYSLGRTVIIKYPRYGYDAGRPMRIISTETDHENRQLVLELWG